MHHSRRDVSDHSEAGCAVSSSNSDGDEVVDERDDEDTGVNEEDPVPGDEPADLSEEAEISLAVFPRFVILFANDLGGVNEECS